MTEVRFNKCKRRILRFHHQTHQIDERRSKPVASHSFTFSNYLNHWISSFRQRERFFRRFEKDTFPSLNHDSALWFWFFLFNSITKPDVDPYIPCPNINTWSARIQISHRAARGTLVPCSFFSHFWSWFATYQAGVSIRKEFTCTSVLSVFDCVPSSAQPHPCSNPSKPCKRKILHLFHL